MLSTFVSVSHTAKKCELGVILNKLRNISYEMRLKEFGLTTLETRRLGGDQIDVFKILTGYEHIERNILFSRLRKREGLEDMELH